MKNQLAPLLKNIHTRSELTEQLRQMTSDTEGLKEITQAAEKLPVATITLATTPPKEEIRRLGQWFRQNVNPQALLEIRQDPKIIGGCQIIWQGVEGDFSLRRKFQE